MENNNSVNQGIPVKNAGVVLLQSYVPMLFERLGLVRERQFMNAEAQQDAVHYLQYLATGINDNKEHVWSLNKVLCGPGPDQQVKAGITVSGDQQILIEGLLKAAISHWPAIGNCSIDGFRGNWLVRDGLLSEKEDRWELSVEKRAYDLLINRSPFSFAIIKFPWMSKTLHVNWAF